MKLSQRLLEEFDQVPRAVMRSLYLLAALLAVAPAALPQTTNSKSAIEYYNRGSDSLRKHGL
jgi:hypothetical protein